VKLDPIYLITDRNAPPGGDFLGALRAALEGGVRFLQFREKDLPHRARYELGEKVMALAGGFGAAVIVNGDPALAEALGAAGVHLGRGTLSVRDVRERLGYKGLIGYSAHSGQEAAAAFAEGAAFSVLSPVFPAKSKFTSGPVLGLDGFRAGVEQVSAAGHRSPVYALGGVGADNAAACLRAGAQGVALIGGILGANDPAAAAVEIRKAMTV
jgi:thiamine-phosphate pyrophosphorylase